jgi:subfamily B ATP-binding cassette protein MsbA
VVTPPVPASRGFVPQFRRILHLAEPPRWAGWGIVLLGLLAAVLEGVGLVLFIPLLQSLGARAARGSGIQQVLDRLFAPVPADWITAVLVAALCASILLKNAANTLNTWLTRAVDGQVAHRLRTQIFDQVLTSCIDYRAGTRRTDIATTLSANSWKVSAGLTLFYRSIVALLTVIVFTLLMIGISPVLTGFATLFLVVAAFVIRFSTRAADATGQAVVEENKQFGLRMWESIESLQLIRAFGQEDFERERFRVSSDRVRRRLLKLDLLWALPGPVSEIAITLLIAGLIIAAHSTGIAISALAAFLSLLYRMQAPVRELMQSRVALDGLAGSIDDVDRLLVTSREPFLAQGDEIAGPLKVGIALTDVWFRYGDDQPWALEDVSLAIPAGKTTAIVGESGAGKSTLLSLLFRFQDPNRGIVTADGVPLPAFSLASWRGNLAVMSQDVQLFHDTIAANIAYGSPDATREDIVAAAGVARADTFIANLKGGYNAVVGDRGLRLSGGQRQRIALARTILRNPGILLLDEATNALDVESERAFQFALERYSHLRTVIVIAHRLATIQNADHVIVLSQGRVVEAGAPADLLQAGGAFARLSGLQQQGSPVPAAAI